MPLICLREEQITTVSILGPGVTHIKVPAHQLKIIGLIHSTYTFLIQDNHMWPPPVSYYSSIRLTSL